MRRQSRVYFEAGGLVSGALGARLRQFGYKTRVPESAAHAVTYYDTQDGRLHSRRARLSYRSEEAGTRGWWLIEQENAALEWVCGVESPPAGEKAFGIRPGGAALPEGEPLTEKLRGLAAGKTLYPVLRVRVTGERFGVVAPDGSETDISCLRWVFYPPFNGGPGDSKGSKPLDFVELAAPSAAAGGRVTNAAEFAYLSILLRDVMGLEPSVPNPLVLGLEALDRPLPGAPVLSKFRVSGDDPLPAAVCKVLGAQAYKMRANTEGTLLDLDPEFLHDLRVATRRSRFALKYARLVAETGVCDALREELAWVSGALGPVRDLDVLIQGFEENLARAQAGDDARELARGLLAGRRARALAELKRTLDSERYRRVIDSLSSFQTCAPLTEGTHPSIPPGQEEGPTAREAAPGLVTKALKRVKKTMKKHAAGGAGPHAGSNTGSQTEEGRVEAAGTPSPKRAASKAPEFAPAALHELRIAFKGLRYTCEFFLPAFGGGMRSAVRTIVVFQDCLGRYQDAAAAAELLKDVFLEAAREEPGVKTDTLLAFGALIQIQRDDGLLERKRFSELWKYFKRLDRKLRRLVVSEAPA